MGPDWRNWLAGDMPLRGYSHLAKGETEAQSNALQFFMESAMMGKG